MNGQRFTEIPVPNVSRLIAQLNGAALPETLPYRGVYDQGAQMRLGRSVLEESLARRIAGLGGMLQRSSGLTAPPPRLGRRQPGDAVDALASNLAVVRGQLDRMAERLALAVERTGPAAPTSTADAAHVAEEAASRRGVPAPLRVLAAPLVHRAERHLLHLAVHSGTNVELDLTPQDFQSPRHANTWRAIQQLRERGEPVNYVSVFQETRNPFPHQPVLSDKQLTGMEFAGKPNASPERIAKSLRTVVDASLSRAFNGTRTALTREPRPPADDRPSPESSRRVEPARADSRPAAPHNRRPGGNEPKLGTMNQTHPIGSRAHNERENTMQEKDITQITQAQMDIYVEAGLAERWTRSLGGRVPVAARVDGTWWVVHEGSDAFQRAEERLATLLDTASVDLAEADAAVAVADACARP
jgi:hypothetical protein